MPSRAQLLDMHSEAVNLRLDHCNANPADTVGSSAVTRTPCAPAEAAAPALVTLHVWGVPRHHIPTALLHMALDRGPVRRTPGLRFGKLLGTGTGRTFTVADADPRHWALLAAWDTAADAAAFERSAVVRRWERTAEERLRVELLPLGSRGRWSGRAPFGLPRTEADDGIRRGGPVAAVTRARITTRKAVTFWRAVPPVSADLHAAPGLLLAFGIGEAPVGLQGTFSVWESAAALRRFAYEGAPHAAVVRRTTEEQWYAEELFARFAVVRAEGSVGGRRVSRQPVCSLIGHPSVVKSSP